MVLVWYTLLVLVCQSSATAALLVAVALGNGDDGAENADRGLPYNADDVGDA
jgi:hypothetical protein